MTMGRDPLTFLSNNKLFYPQMTQMPADEELNTKNSFFALGPLRVSAPPREAGFPA